MKVEGLTTIMEDVRPGSDLTEAVGVYRPATDLVRDYMFRCSVTAFQDFPEKGAAVIEVWHHKALEWHEVLSWDGSSAMMREASYTTDGIDDLFQKMIDYALDILDPL